MEANKKVDLAKLSSEEFLKLVEESNVDELMKLVEECQPASAISVPRASTVSRVLAVNEGNRGFFSIVKWWELRRPLYILLVGLCGLPGLAWLVLHCGSQLLTLCWFGSACFYGFAANVCYTMGWVSEYAARRCFGDKAMYFGSISFALGTGFSMALTVVLSLWVAIIAPSIPIFGTG